MQTKLLLPIPAILLLVGCAASVGNLPALTAENEESLWMWEKQHVRILPPLPKGLSDGTLRLRPALPERHCYPPAGIQSGGPFGKRRNHRLRRTHENASVGTAR